MIDAKTVTAIVMCGLMYQHQAMASSDSSTYPSQTSTNYQHHDIHRLFSDLKESDKIFVSRNSLFRPYVVTDDDEIKELFTVRAKGIKVPSKKGSLEFSPSKMTWVNASSILSFLFRRYVADNQSFNVPFVASTDNDRSSRAFDQHYNASNLCAGMGYFESSLKNICAINNRDSFGLVEINYNPDIGLFSSKYRIRLIPENGIKESLSHKLFLTFASLIGMFSNHNQVGFSSPLSTFDYHLTGNNTFVTENTRFSDMQKNCVYDSISTCHFKFVGENTESLLANGKEIKSLSDFSSKNRFSIHFTKSGSPKFNLSNTLLSGSSYINYGFYNQAELEMFRDLGYNINSREFFGTSIYNSGTPENRGVYDITSSFTASNGEFRTFMQDKASIVPLSIGTHVYGSYNDVTQSGIIASQGFGSIGIRIDGSRNRIIVPKSASIIENGESATGIAVTYGRNNIIDISGEVEANGEDGAALRFDFGSNVLSDMKEFRGSYRRVRTYDYLQRKIPKDQAESYNVPNNIRGPLVSTLNISGKITGRKYSIYIDDTAHVGDINITNKAKIYGDIVSKWNYYVSPDGNSFYSKAYNPKLLAGKLHFDAAYGDKLNVPFFIKKLATNINLGVKKKNKAKDFSSDNLIADNKSHVEIKGNIIGKTINLLSYGGVSDIVGLINLNRLYIKDSSVFIDSPNGNHNSVVEILDLSRGGQLDLTNGESQTFIVKDKASISSKSVICLDAVRDGTIIDDIRFEGSLFAPDGVVNIEPGISYNDIKRFSSDPKALLEFMNTFVRQANQKLDKYQAYTKFPKHLWYTQGEMGRSVNCSPRGCYIGDFINTYSNATKPLPMWRYILSIVGCILMLAFSVVLVRKTGSGRYG